MNNRILFYVHRLTYMSLIFIYLILARVSLAQELESPPSASSSEPDDFNKKIYFKNKLEFSFDTAWLPYNIPFIFNPLMQESWTKTPLDYTLVPLIFSLRWHLSDLSGPWFLRGNTDCTFSGSYTAIPQGPESYYVAYNMGIRYNFVQPNWRIAPYLEGRAGLGFTDAKGPKGVQYAQGEDFTFNIIMGGGMRYNFNPRYSISAGIAYMHISNLYLSEPKVNNYGINVFGPTIGVNIGF